VTGSPAFDCMIVLVLLILLLDGPKGPPTMPA